MYRQQQQTTLIPQQQQQQQQNPVQWAYTFPLGSCDWDEFDGQLSNIQFQPTILSKKDFTAQYASRVQPFLQKTVKSGGEKLTNKQADDTKGDGSEIQTLYGRMEKISMCNLSLYQVPNGLSNYRSQIKELYLSNNQIEEISNEIFTLRNLLTLHLDHNLIREIPSRITQLTKLTDFNISHNKLRVLPFDIGRMPKLIKFLAEGNPFDDAFMNSHLEIKQYIANGEARNLVRYFVNHMPIPEINISLLEREFKSINKPDTTTPANETAFVRVMTYNILCPSMATVDMYMTTPDSALDWNYRRERIIHEIEMYNPDIVCLQEVQAKIIEPWFYPEMKRLGYEGFYIMKSRGRWYHCADTVDCCLILYRSSSVTLIKHYEIEYSLDAKRLIRNESTSSVASSSINESTPSVTPPPTSSSQSPQPTSLVSSASSSLSSTALGEKDASSVAVGSTGDHDSFLRLSKKDNVALVGLFEANGVKFFVSDTHIHWDPENSDLKIMQAQFLVEHLMSYAKADFADMGGLEAAPLIVAGDYNSTPESGVYQLMSTGSISSTHPDWRGSDFGHYTSEGIHNPLHFENAYAPLNIKYTNHTISYTGVLDYIWYTPATLKVLSLLDVPPLSVFENDLKLSLPNVFFPSDHLALLADFQVFKKKK